MKEPIETLQLKMYEYKKVLEHHDMIMLTNPNSDSENIVSVAKEKIESFQMAINILNSNDLDK